MNNRIITLFIALSLLVASCSASGNAATTPPEAIPPVIAYDVIIAKGNIEPIHYAEISFNASGVVSELFVDEGQTGKKGDVLVRLGNSESAQAEVARAEEALILAQRAFDTSQSTVLKDLGEAYEAVRQAQIKFDNFDIPTKLKNGTPAEGVEKMYAQVEVARTEYEPYKYLSDGNESKKIHKDRLDNAWSDLNQAIRWAKLEAIGVDPLGGASVDFWKPIAERYGLKIEVVNEMIDPTFSFMTVDRDGKIRMDCSSPYAMERLIQLKDHFDVAFGNDTDVDRHGIVTKGTGLMNPNHYLSAAIWYLFRNRPGWSKEAAIGKTLVSTSMIDRIGTALGRKVAEVPVGFKWFVDGLLDGSYGFGGEESAGASFLRKVGKVWTTDKDGIIMDLLACEITARTGKDPAELYRELENQFGRPWYIRIDAPATPVQKSALDTPVAALVFGNLVCMRTPRGSGRNNASVSALPAGRHTRQFTARLSGGLCG